MNNKKMNVYAYGIIAIHGGRIEPGTDIIAKNIAQGKIPLYVNTQGPHVTSKEFRNEKIQKIFESCAVIVSIHGEKNRDYEYVMVGGLHQHLAKKVEKSLVDAGFSIKNAPDGINGDDPNNVCNLGQTKKGVQLEISRKLRDRLVSDRSLSNLFSEAIASCL